MKKDFKQFTAGTSGDHNYHFAADIGGMKVLILNNVFHKTSEINISKAFIELDGASIATNVSVYWDSTGALTDYSDLDNDAVKLDFTTNLNNVARFDVTKALATILKENDLQRNERYIIVGNNIPTSGISCSISVYYDYKRGFRERNATVPVELKNAKGSIDLSDGSMHMSFVVNNGYGRIPASINYCYDSNLATEVDKIYLDNDQYEQINYMCGKGWKTNYHQYIVAERSNNFLSDGESVGFFTWVNAQGNHIIFAEKFYATINSKKVFLKLSQLDVDAQGNYTYTLDDVTYPVVHDYACRQLFKLKEVAVSSTEKKIEITDLTDNKMSFEQTTMATHNGVVIYRLNKIEDSYANAVNISYNTSGWLTQIASVGGNTVNIIYNDEGNGLIWEIRDMLTASTYIETVIDSNADWDICQLITSENHRNISFTNYADSNKLKTVLDSIGNGFFFETVGNITKVISIAKNGGIVNGQIVPITGTTQTKSIDGVTYKYVDIYKITYSELYAQLEFIRDKEKMSYHFDCLGRCVSQYANNYDGEGLGNPQGATFVIDGENINIEVQNVFESNDLCQDATYTGTVIANITDVGSADERSKLIDFATKMSAKAGTNKNVYYANSSTSSSTINATLSASAISNIKQSASTDFVISGWTMAKSLPLVSRARGYIVGHRNEEIPYTISKEANELNNSYEVYRANRKFSLCASVSYSSSTGVVTDLFRASFDSANTEFQYLQIPIRLRKNEKSNISSISVYVDYSNNNGRIYLYGVAMKAGSWSIEKYNEDKMVTYSKNAEQSNYYSESYYNSNKLLSESYVNEENNEVDEFSVTYTYNSHKDIIMSLDSEGFAEENTYNNKGDLLKSKKYHKYDAYDSYAFISESTYDELTGDELTANSSFGDLAITKTYNHGALATKIPALSATIAYGYDDSLSLVKSLTAQTVPPIVANNTFLKGTALTHSDSGSAYAYDYDGFGRVTSIKIDGEAYCSIEYKNENEKIITYVNNEKERTKTDKNDKELAVYCTDRNGQGGGNTAIELKMSAYGTFKDLIDEMSGGTKYKAEYDDCGRALKSVVENKEDSYYDVTIKREYDKNGVVTSQIVEHDAYDIDEVNYTYEDKYDGKLIQAEHSAIGDENQSFDELNRICKVGKFNESLERAISYHENGDDDKNITCNLVACDEFMIDNVLNDSYIYMYDALSRLTEVRKSNTIYKKYSYDLVGRLSREDNRDLNKTFTFEYDLAGNILSRKEYAFTLDATLPSMPVLTVPYTYDSTHKDRLTGYNGQTVGGYEIGNPWTYRGKAATWKNVNRLASYNGITFDYNYGGIRTSKTVNGVKTKYAINDNNIISEQKGTDTTTRITYFYGIDGVTAFKYAGATYYYKKNFLGDILGLYNSSKQLVAKYVYDAWGNHKVLNLDGTENTSSTFIGNINPFRYRSYYFDSETGFYYLQSRYYDPQVGRFLNMDAIEQLDESIVNGINLYAYCCNDPINTSDPDGTWLHILIGAAVGAIAGVVGQVVSDVAGNLLSGKPVKLSSASSYIGAALGGAAGGATLAATGSTTAADAVSGMVTTASSMLLSNLMDGTDYSAGEIIVNTFYDTATSVVAGKIIKLPTLNSGRGNYSAVYRGVLTKMRKDVVKKMSLKTMLKGLTSTVVSNIPMNIFSGVKFVNYKRARMEILLPMIYGRSNGGGNGQYITAR